MHSRCSRSIIARIARRGLLLLLLLLLLLAVTRNAWNPPRVAAALLLVRS
jgi:hypothetical protein